VTNYEVSQLTNAVPAGPDLVPFVDVDDTSTPPAGPNGSDKNATVTQLASVVATLAQFFAPTGLTGSTAASRYVGATASGAPLSGAHSVGDWVIDQTGKIFICTSAGTPGGWTQAGGGGSSFTDGLAYAFALGRYTS